MEHYSGQTEISWPATQRREGEVEHYSGQTEIRGQLHRGVRAKWNTTPVKLRSDQLHRGVRAKWNTTPVKLSQGPATQRCEGEVEHYSGQTEIRGQLPRGVWRVKWSRFHTTPVKLRSGASYTEV